MKKSMKKEFSTIHILPEVPCGSFREFEKYLNLAATLDYIPDSCETIKKIHWLDVRYLMEYNNNFFNAVVKLCSKHVNKMIQDAKRESRAKRCKRRSLSKSF